VKLVKIGTLVCVTSIMAGCGGGDSEKQLLLGPGANEAEANAAIDAIISEVDDVFIADGTTEYTALTTGSVSYTGLIFGYTEAGGTGPEIDYAADLELAVDFDTDGVTGKVSNFATSLTDFENPSGTISLTGDVVDGGPNAEIYLSNSSGVLTGTNGVTAEYFVDGSGVFGGTDGNVLSGNQETDFEWLTGPDTGTTSWSDAGFAATRD
jgi:hypothetical protein